MGGGGGGDEASIYCQTKDLGSPFGSMSRRMDRCLTGSALDRGYFYLHVSQVCLQVLLLLHKQCEEVCSLSEKEAQSEATKLPQGQQMLPHECTIRPANVTT